MKIFLSAFFILQFLVSYSQKNLDTRITVTVEDTIDLLSAVKLAFVNSDFVVKDNHRVDTISTYPLNIKSTTYMSVLAFINGNTVEFWGYIADTHSNLLGATILPPSKEYTKIFYFKNDRYWKKLLSIAKNLNGNISYGKERKELVNRRW